MENPSSAFYLLLLLHTRPAAALIRGASCVEDELHAVTVFERGRILNGLAAFAKRRNYRG
jgi:hypothetical protein